MDSQRQRQYGKEEESVHTEHTESVHETNVTPTGDGNQGSLQLEPEVRDAIARDVVLILKNILPNLLFDARKKNKEEDKENNEDKVYDSDGDEVRVGSSNRGCTYKGFKDSDPPKFDGNKDSVATLEWIERMNTVFNISECRPDQAVKPEEAHNPKVLPQNEIDRVENEFLNFKAGNKTHRQYTSRFNKLAQLVPHLVETEDRLIKYYVKGLPQRVRVHVKANLLSTFESVVNLSGIVYDDFANEDTTPETRKRKWENPSKGNGKGTVMPVLRGQERMNTEYAQNAENCKDVKCQSCGRYVHLTKDCRRTGQAGSGQEKEAEKEQPKARTQANALTEEEARGNPDVVSGTFLVNDEHATILFDSGASKRFISNAFSRKLDRTINTIVKAFSIQTTVGKNSAIFQVIEDCIIKIEGHKFPSRLFLLTLGGFDIVLGMDWLATNEAQIICKHKRIHLKAPSGSPIMVNYGK
ncbi:hypothetical protein L1987_65042 [Smallanthus sonchifolius]|uniref:Uncharacterized protein n=1 Tax=Smallanthus sonchifolius TaxID=185202 RepID=A0ACB9BTC9_9ASTR|nr:hypothetical protein L1987_65042 [Smallanthus sonchifolius]